MLSHLKFENGMKCLQRSEWSSLIPKTNLADALAADGCGKQVVEPGQLRQSNLSLYEKLEKGNMNKKNEPYGLKGPSDIQS